MVLNTTMFVTEPPQCPLILVQKYHWIATYFSYPSVSFIYGITLIISLIFSVIISLKYNSVKVFNKKVKSLFFLYKIIKKKIKF